jgi:hypothetical protein
MPGVSTNSQPQSATRHLRQTTVDPRKFASSPVAWPVRPRNSADLPTDSRPASITWGKEDFMIDE